MRDRITAIVAVLLLALLAGSSYWFSQTTRLGALAGPVSREGPDIVVDGATLTQFLRPRMVSLRADQPQVDARANHARVEDSGARVLLSGDVTLIRTAGKAGEPAMRMTTERLVALPDLEQFSTDAPVTIERGGSSISAVGMDYDNLKRTVKFRSQVRGTVEPAAATTGTAPR